MKAYFRKYCLYIALLSLGACANIVTPSGGAKDVKPPVVLKTMPLAYSKNFKGKTIRIDFDEFVKITDAAGQVIISPFMKETPDLKLRGKSIVINFKDTLKPATTYSIAFGKSIADINEGNVLLNYRYVLSTGNIIDILTLKGIVKNAFTGKPETGVIVMLYDHIYDSVPYKETPFYIAKTNESGEFYFSNLKSGVYKIFALKDGNNNFLFDQPNENIAFMDSLVTTQPLDTAKADSAKKNRTYSLSLFEEPAAAQRMMKASPAMYGKLVFVFRKPLSDFSIIPFHQVMPSPWCIQEVNKTRDTVTLWLKNPDTDTLHLKITENNVILDTVEIGLIKKGGKRSKDRTSELKNTGIKANALNNGIFDFHKTFTLEMSTPVAEYDFSKIIFKENKDTLKAAFAFTDSLRRHLQMDYKFKEETTYSLFIPPSTFKDMLGLSNDTVKIKFRTTSLKDYGNIKLKLKHPDLSCNLIVQLISDNDVVAQEKFTTSVKDVIDFSFVKPGNYKIKAICDENNNKKWDTGNYLKKNQPEKVFYYSVPFTVKANWDADFDWNITN